MYALKTAQKLPKSVKVEWEDGMQAIFNYVWLRDNSIKRPSLVHLDLDARPEDVRCSKNSLNLVWPPFSQTNYSSDFLREVASTSSSKATGSFLPKLPLVSEAQCLISNGADVQPSSLLHYQLEQQICSIVDASTEIAPENVIGSTHWRSTFQEPGTVWPHLQSVPSLCSVESVNGRIAELFIVDTTKALRILFQKHPVEFEFLAKCTLEYEAYEGLLKARHPIVEIKDGEIVPGVFNNFARSSSILVEAVEVEKLYASLQKFGRVIAESMVSIQLHPGQRLLVDNTRTMLGAPAQLNRELLLRCLL